MNKSTNWSNHLRKENQANVVLIAWHHGHINDLISASVVIPSLLGQQ
jgi:hypothetical protein